ncbi:uncharacterized protein LOC141613708 [Silene latifolia]|uniref:uncharacterized protein LOC141613708 n=1 Tax=Silene latifolia TaxID=37657 RepID=UPI003D776BBC
MQICSEKRYGGLDIVNARIWNQVVIGKYTWWLAAKADHMWIKWVDHVYMKGKSWQEYTPSSNSRWTWRKICQIRDVMKPGYLNGKWIDNNGNYSVSSGYKWLCGQQSKVTWCPVIWTQTSIPKHSFIGWLVVQERLMTRERLLNFGFITDGACLFRQSHLETHQHLMYECKFSQLCWDLIRGWLEIDFPTPGLVAWCLNWRCKSLMKKQIVFTAIVAAWYHLWHAKNVCRLEAVLITPSVLLKQVKQDVCRRCKDRVWSLKAHKLPWEPTYD